MFNFGKVRFLKAVKIFDGEKYLPSDTVLVFDGPRIKDIVRAAEVDPGRVERIGGILLPGFVNAHTHLELSHMKNTVPRNTGLPEFGISIVTRRGAASDDEMLEHMKEADREMRRNGIVAAGDISNSPLSTRIKERAQLAYHTFVELIGIDPRNAGEVFARGLQTATIFANEGLRVSLAAHAPYSVSSQLIRLIAKYDSESGVPFSMHHEESVDEIRFMRGEPSGFDELYRMLGIDISWRNPEEGGHFDYHALPRGTPCLLVHNTESRDETLRQLAVDNVYFCLCPAANLYICGKRPAAGDFMQFPERLCFGTDSLASNDTLDVLKEANLFCDGNTDPSDPRILKALTFNGAKALGIGSIFGKLAPGRAGGLNHIETRDGKLRLLEPIF